MIIEWHTHVYPPEETGDNPALDGKIGPGWGGRCPMTLENVLDAHYKSNIDITVVSNALKASAGRSGAEASVPGTTERASAWVRTRSGRTTKSTVHHTTK